MAQQTINVGTSPNDGTGTPLRTAFQYTYSSLKLLFVYWKAVRSGVPVPSLGDVPTLMVCCAISN